MRTRDAQIDDVGLKVKSLRKRLAKSQREFGKQLGVSQAAVSQWESGEFTPEPEIIVRMITLALEARLPPEDLSYFASKTADLIKDIEPVAKALYSSSRLSSDLIEIPIIKGPSYHIDPEIAPAELKGGAIAIPRTMLFEEKNLSFREVGDEGMFPLILKGDLVLVGRIIEPHNYVPGLTIAAFHPLKGFLVRRILLQGKKIFIRDEKDDKIRIDHDPRWMLAAILISIRRWI